MPNKKELLEHILKFLLKYKFTILFLLYLCAITVCATYKGLGDYVSKPSIFHAFTFFFVLHILAKIKYSIIPTVLFALLLSIDAYFAFCYFSSLSVGLLASIAETNTKEAGEAFWGGLLQGTVILAFTFSLTFLAKKELKAAAFSLQKSLVALLIYTMLLMPAVMYRKFAVNEVWKGSFILHPLNTVQALSSQHFPLIYNDFVTFACYENEMIELHSYLEGNRILPEGVLLTDRLEVPEKLFFVLGESSRRDHYSLYGYAVPTTPFLDSLAQVPTSPLKYYTAIAPATFTRDATRMLLSFSTPNDVPAFFERKNILEVAEAAGYETVWISGQTPLGSYLGLITSFANKSFYDTSPTRCDMDLLPIIEKMIIPSKKQVFIIHLEGSHLSYTARFDKQDAKAIGASDAIGNYDRTIHHTDRVLSGIFNIMKKNNSSILYYAPDHGEIIGKGHGFMEQSAAQFNIPLITINCSAVPINSIIERYIDPQTSLINTSSSAYIVSEALGYSVAPQNASKSMNEGRYVLHANGQVYLYKDTKDLQ